MDDGGGGGAVEAFGEHHDEVMAILLGKDDDGGVIIDGPVGAIPSPADFVVNCGSGEAGGKALAPIVEGVGIVDRWGGGLVEHGILDDKPLVGGEVGMFPVELEEANEVAGGRVEAGGGSTGKIEVGDESFDAGGALGVAVHEVGAAVVGFANHEVKAGTESEVAFGGGGKVGVGVGAASGNFAVAVVDVEEFVDGGGVENGIGLIAGDGGLVIEIINHDAEVDARVGARLGDPLVDYGLEVEEGGGVGLTRVIRGGRIVGSAGLTGFVGENGGGLVIGLQRAVEQAKADDGGDNQYEEGDEGDEVAFDGGGRS